MNVAAIYFGLTCLVRPSRLRPTLTVDEFSDIPSNIQEALQRRIDTQTTSSNEGAHRKKIDIRALVLDKDNCFAKPYTTDVWPAYKDRWSKLRAQFPGDRILIVSNSAGTRDDVAHREAKLLESTLQTKVLLHDTKKPGCGQQILDHFYNARTHTSDSIPSSDSTLHSGSVSDITSPDQVVVIGDRLFTDVVLANTMGAHSIWIRHGAVRDFGPLSKLEKWIIAWIDP